MRRGGVRGSFEKYRVVHANLRDKASARSPKVNRVVPRPWGSLGRFGGKKFGAAPNFAYNLHY